MTQPSGASAARSALDPDYPEADRLDLIDEIHATPVADPYRWLEDPEDPRTIEWGERQDARYAAWAQRRRSGDVGRFAERVRERLAELGDAGTVSVAVRRGANAFLTRRGPGMEHPVLYISEPDGAERALIDPIALDPSGITTLDGWFPAADGSLLAYFVSVGGGERPRLRVMDVASGEDVDGPIDGSAAYSLAWLPDGTGFYYQRRPTAEQIEAGVLGAHLLVYLHRLGTPSSSDVLITRPETGLPASGWFAPFVSPDGRWLRMDAEWGMSSNDVYLADLAGGDLAAPAFRNLRSGSEAKTAVCFGGDGRVYALTTADAPNGRLCVIDPERPEYEHWHTLLPEDPGAVLKDFAILGADGTRRPRLLAHRSRHALSELTLHDLETGVPLADGPPVQLPGLGTVRDLRGGADGESAAYFTYTDFTTPPSVYRFDAHTGAVELWASAPGAAAASAGGAEARVQVNQVTYSSYDGTEVRMFILSPTGRADRPRPTILYGYGAHGLSRVPLFTPQQVAWVEAGGVYAIANIRGGAEEGAAWHLAGMRGNRQNTFADFHAAGDHLVDQGWTTRDRLGIHGVSAGGQMVSVVLAQRPDAYRVVLCSAGQSDMIRAELAGSAALWIGERGTVRDPEQFGWLIAQSPYHMVREGTEYPAILLAAFEGDARVAPWHARKFTAALQHATSAAPAERPILLRRESGVGHVARSASRLVDLWTEQLCFAAAHLGLADEAHGR